MSIIKISEIYISKMTAGDIDDVVQIEAEAYGAHHWSKSAFYDEMQNNLAKYYVAKTNRGELVGYAGTWHIIDEGHITTIAVKKSHLRQHIGEAIIIKILEDCYEAGVKYLTLEVRVSNEPAINLYKKYGFNSLGTRKGYYQDNNEDALIMWTENIFYDKFKTIFSSIFANFNFSFASVMLLGYKVSSMEYPKLLNLKLEGKEKYIGGEFLIMGSKITLIAFSAIIITWFIFKYKVWQYFTKQKIKFYIYSIKKEFIDFIDDIKNTKYRIKRSFGKLKLLFSRRK